MVQIAGKYELVENKNYYELLLKRGYTEEKAKKANEFKSTIELEVDGNKIRVTSSSEASAKHVNDFVLNEEITEISPSGTELKATMTQNGNVVTIQSKQADGSPGMKRIATFSDTGLELKMVSSKEDVPVAIRIFKRSS